MVEGCRTQVTIKQLVGRRVHSLDMVIKVTLSRKTLTTIRAFVGFLVFVHGLHVLMQVTYDCETFRTFRAFVKFVANVYCCYMLFNISLLLQLLSQSSHGNLTSEWIVSKCNLRPLLCVNLESHWPHSYVFGSWFGSWWMAVMWVFKFDDWENLESHKWHLKGFSPVCILKCFLA